MSLIQDFAESRWGWATIGFLTGLALAAITAALGFAACGCDAFAPRIDPTPYPCHDPRMHYCESGHTCCFDGYACVADGCEFVGAISRDAGRN